MKRSVCIFLLGFAAVLLAGSGCSRFVGPEERPRPLTEEEWKAALEDRGRHWQRYTASFHLRADSAKGKYPLRAVVLADLPDRLRLEAFNLFGQTLGVIIYNKGESSLWVPNEKTLYTARKPEVLTEHFLGVSLPLNVLGYSLAASLPPEQLETFKLLSERSRWVGQSHAKDDGWRYEWSFLSQPMTFKAFEARQGLWHYTVNYDPPVPLEVTEIPRRIVFLSSDWQMDVTIDQIQTESHMWDDLFLPLFPGGVRRVSLDEHP